MHRVEHILRVIRLEREAIALAVAAVCDGILEAARLAHHRNRAVAQRDHLRKAAGLALAGHQENIGAGVNFPRELRHKAEAEHEAARVFRLHLLEELLVLPVAAAEHGKLRVRVRHNIVHSALDEVEALVGDEARDHADHRHVRIDLQIQALLQLRLIDRLARHVLHIVVLVEALVGGRIIADRIDAVQNAGELPRALAQDGVELMREPRVENLLRIRRAHRGDPVRAFDRALHQVDAFVVLEQAALRLWDAENILEDLKAILPLILNVVDREQRFDAAVPVVVRVEQAVVDRHQRRLPVVHVDNVGLKFDVRQHLEHGAGEESKALGVVEVAVKPLTLEVILVVDEIVDHIADLRLKDAAILAAPRHRHADAGEEFHFLTQLLRNALVKRHDDAAADQARAERLRQGAGNVCKAACRRKGQRLTGAEQYFHKIHQSFSACGKPSTQPFLRGCGPSGVLPRKKGRIIRPCSLLR